MPSARAERTGALNGLRTDEVRAAGARDVALGVRADDVGERGLDDVVPLLRAVCALDALRDVRHARGDDLVQEGLCAGERERAGDRLQVCEELGRAERIIGRAADERKKVETCVSAGRAVEHAMQREHALLRAQDLADRGVQLLHDGRQLRAADVAEAQRAQLGLAARGDVARDGGQCGVRADRGLAHSLVPGVERCDEGRVIAGLQDRDQARGVEAGGTGVGEHPCECRLALTRDAGGFLVRPNRRSDLLEHVRLGPDHAYCCRDGGDACSESSERAHYFVR